jgi:hypothetical protein
MNENKPINTKKGPAGGPGILALAGGELNLCLSKYPDDLLGRKSFPLAPDLLSGLRCCLNTNSEPGPVCGGQVKGSEPLKVHESGNISPRTPTQVFLLLNLRGKLLFLRF